MPSLLADMLLRPEYIIIASDRQVVNYRLKKQHKNTGFFPFSGQAIARKMLSQKGRIKDVYTTLRFFKSLFSFIAATRRSPEAKVTM